MTTFSNPTTTLLWLLILFPTALSAQSPPSHRSAEQQKTPRAGTQQAETTPPSTPQPFDKDAVDTILRARRQYGSLLKGTIFEPKDARESERMFVEALQAVMSESAKGQASGTSQRSNDDSHTVVRPAPALDPSIDEPLVRSLELTTWLLQQKARRLRDEQRSDEAERLDALIGTLTAEANRWRTAQRPKSQ